MSRSNVPEGTPTRCWVVLRTQPQRELLAAHAVRASDVESYVPFLPPRRRTERASLLFPGYVFARVAPASDDLLRIRAAPGVSFVLPRAAPPTVLPDSVVGELRARLADPAQLSARRPLQPGERVTIVSGPLRWSNALFDRYLNAAGRVRILLEMVHRTVGVEVEEEALERLPSPTPRRSPTR